MIVEYSMKVAVFTLVVLGPGLPALGQTLLLEDTFDDGVIDPNLWEISLPFGDSALIETGGVLRFENRAWLMSRSGLTGLDQSLIVEGEFSPQIQSGSAGDNWQIFIYANEAPAGPYQQNTDGLLASWAGNSNPASCAIYGLGNVQAPVVGGSAEGGDWKGFRITACADHATLELWNLSHPVESVSYETTFSIQPGAGARIILYNRESTLASHLTLLDNFRVFAIDDCNSNGIPDCQEISDGLSQDCNLNGVLDECEIAADGSLDLNINGILDECECFTAIYCQAVPNTVGPGSLIGPEGIPSLNRNDFSVGASMAPPGQPGVFYFGSYPLDPPIPFGNGLRCVGGDTFRLNPPTTINASGQASRRLDFTQSPTDGFSAGVTAYFQFWYRDHPGVGLPFNLSNAMAVTFCP